MAKKIELAPLWDRISQATLPNQVKLLCNCIEELQNQVEELQPNKVTPPPIRTPGK